MGGILRPIRIGKLSPWGNVLFIWNGSKRDKAMIERSLPVALGHRFRQAPPLRIQEFRT